MRGKRLGAFACAGLFAVSALAQETQTLVDPDGQVTTLAGGESIQSTPLSSIRDVQRSIGLGGVVPIPEFTGERQESWEPDQQPNFQCPPCFYDCLPDLAFQGVAEVCAQSAHITGSWGFGCTIRPHGGGRLYGSTGSATTFTFVDGMEAFRFGGYFGTNNPSNPDATVDFFDVNDNLIDSVVAEFPNDCTWTWHGWESATPIKRLVITGFFGQGGFIDLDDLEWSQGGSESGACCLPDGSCTDDVPQGDCFRARGRFAADTLCADLDPPCEEQTGRCCIEGGGGCTRDPEWICDGDTDGDGQVNPVDSGLVQAAFGSEDPQDLCNYDVDCDGQINPVDSGIVQSLFGTCDPPRDSCGGGGGDPECAVITGTECDARGGEFAGFGTDCEGDPCGFATGACCLELECSGTTRKAECDDRGGAWFEGQTCPEFQCPEVLGCAWDNGIIPNGVNARALSPPGFPDIRVVDDIVAGVPGCTILNFHANVIEDAGWSEDGMIQLFVYEDSGSGPGALLTSVDTEFTKVDTGDDYFGRDDFEYWVEGVSIDLPEGTSWIGLRNPGGGGAGTNYWMTSDGGSDGPGSDTGWFSLDAGSTWQAEGDPWHHAFEIVP